MGDELRRTLDELALRYELEPFLADVYVEGPTDVGFLRWLLQALGISDARVYAIDSVDIPSSEVTSRKLAVGARGRVISLALFLAEHQPNSGKDLRVVCLADADEATLLGVGSQPPTLILTDFPSIEVYCAEAQVLRKFFAITTNSRVNADRFIGQCLPVLTQIFALKVTNVVTNSDLPHLDLRGCLKARKGELAFDREEYLHRYVSRLNLRLRGEFLAALEETMKRITASDLRFYVDGWDLVLAVTQVIRPYVRQQGLREPGTVRALLMSCLTIDVAEQYPTIQNLRDRLSP